MYQVGITGGIGSGKTLVCSILEVLGIPVYYADREARKLMDTNAALRKKIEELFGKESYREGALDRKYVGGRVFGNRELLEQLNRLVHPVVREDYRSWAGERKGVPYVVEEAAVLFESGASRFMDRTVLVYAPEALRMKRVMERDGVSSGDVSRRMMHQMDEEKKKILADEVIVNDDRNMLVPQVVDLHYRIINRK
jgi:dephospho-CoA kinase